MPQIQHNVAFSVAAKSIACHTLVVAFTFRAIVIPLSLSLSRSSLKAELAVILIYFYLCERTNLFSESKKASKKSYEESRSCRRATKEGIASRSWDEQIIWLRELKHSMMWHSMLWDDSSEARDNGVKWTDILRLSTMKKSKLTIFSGKYLFLDVMDALKHYICSRH